MSHPTAVMNRVEDRHWRAMAQCIKERRLLARLSQQALARLSGLSVSEIQHIENGRRHPKTGTQVRICEAVGISHNELTAQVERVCHVWALRGL
jgi:transcriptional regulator with XRE-family HTH domain